MVRWALLTLKNPNAWLTPKDVQGSTYTWLVNSSLVETRPSNTAKLKRFFSHMHAIHNIPIHRISFYWLDSLWRTVHLLCNHVLIQKHFPLHRNNVSDTALKSDRKHTRTLIFVCLSSCHQSERRNYCREKVSKCHRTASSYKVHLFELSDESQNVSFSLLFSIEKYFRITIFPFYCRTLSIGA